MSIPKKIRDTYDNTFKKLISTSKAGKKLRQFLNESKNSISALNLPVKLSDLRTKLFTPSQPVSNLNLMKSSSRKMKKK